MKGACVGFIAITRRAKALSPREIPPRRIRPVVVLHYHLLIETPEAGWRTEKEPRRIAATEPGNGRQLRQTVFPEFIQSPWVRAGPLAAENLNYRLC
jgi:hypothetical protein